MAFKNTIWSSQKIFSLKGIPLKEVGNFLPQFGTNDFGEYQNKNEYLRVIFRYPIGNDKRTIPVSVDRSCAFEFKLSWCNENSENAWFVQESLRKIHHNFRINSQDIPEFLQESVEKAKNTIGIYKQWFATEIRPSEAMAWIESKVMEKWGVEAAVRCYHISFYGYDGKARRYRKNVPLNGQILDDRKPVEDILTPVRNVFHLFQALCWVANNRESVDIQLKKMDRPQK